ncbi:MAG: septal ring lytic transglycosylase RlpA family protein [Candidatus Acidiferrales bacterium]
MHSKRLFTWAAIRWALLMFVITPVLRAPAQGGPTGPVVHEIEGLGAPAASLANPNPYLHPRPLKVWDCISGWYGEEFDGERTANGETYDMYAPTAAHPTLPLGSVIRVINLSTHRSQVVRINDRGPYVDGRDLDVSFGVARNLGFDRRGLAHVRVELLEVPSRPVSTQPSN